MAKPKRLPRRLPKKIVPSGIGDEGIVGNWLMYYLKGGDHLHDFSPYNNHGTINGAKWVSTRRGWVLEFDGEDDYVDLGTGTFDPSVFTFSVWSKTIKSGKTLIDLGGRASIEIGAATPHGGTADKAVVQVYDGSDRVVVSGTTTVTDGDWHQIVGVCNGSQLFIYVDGNQENSKPQDSPAYALTRDQSIGKYYTGNNYIKGLIDEVRIYDRALSAEEINETYKGKMKVRVTVRNIGSVKIPEAEFVANLKKDGTTVDSDTYTTTSSIDTGDLKTLTFYFNEMRPGGEYNINIPGIDVSQTVNCQSLE